MQITRKTYQKIVYIKYKAQSFKSILQLIEFFFKVIKFIKIALATRQINKSSTTTKRSH